MFVEESEAVDKVCPMRFHYMNGYARVDYCRGNNCMAWVQERICDLPNANKEDITETSRGRCGLIKI